MNYSLSLPVHELQHVSSCLRTTTCLSLSMNYNLSLPVHELQPVSSCLRTTTCLFLSMNYNLSLPVHELQSVSSYELQPVSSCLRTTTCLFLPMTTTCLPDRKLQSVSSCPPTTSSSVHALFSCSYTTSHIFLSIHHKLSLPVHVPQPVSFRLCTPVSLRS